MRVIRGVSERPKNDTTRFRRNNWKCSATAVTFLLPLILLSLAGTISSRVLADLVSKTAFPKSSFSLTKWPEKTGDKVARFVFDRLNEKNMISQDRGMANELLKLVRANLTVDLKAGVDVHCLWCMAHRLNLVVKDFKEVENINFVIRFAKWITASDRLVSYSAFLRTYPRQKRRKRSLRLPRRDGFTTGTR